MENNNLDVDRLINEIDEKISKLEEEKDEIKSKPEDVLDNRYEKITELNEKEEL